MFCPNCSKENPEKQKFCTSCGLNLQPVVQAMTHQSGDQASGLIFEKIRHLLASSWPKSLTYSLFVLLLGLMVVIIGTTLLKEKPVAAIGVMITLLGIALIGFKGVVMIMHEPKRLNQSPFLPQAEPTSKLPEALHSGLAFSITDPTTRELDAGLSQPDEGRAPEKHLGQVISS